MSIPTPAKAGTPNGERMVLLIFLVQAFLTGCAISTGIWARMPWLGIAGLALLGGTLMAVQFPVVAHPSIQPSINPQRGHLSKTALITAWLIAFLAPGSMLLAWGRTSRLDTIYAILAWVIAASVLPATNLLAGVSLKRRCRGVGMILILFADSFWIAYSFLNNRTVAFYFGVGLMIAWLVLLKLWFRLPGPAIQLVNTLLLLCVGLPAADYLLGPKYQFETRPEAGIDYYSYERARKNPTAFARWWQYYLSQWARMGKTLFVKDPEGALPFRLRPNSEATFFESVIRVNSLGFRGKEVPLDKGNAYRIVALGESTTFGCTLNKTDETWPALLETLINQRLNLPRPVQVINAGVPSYTLANNVHRLVHDILPLKPDMIISYHGYNGLRMINDALPARFADTPPPYEPRPLKLLADCEYRFKLTRWKQAQVSKLEHQDRGVADPMNTLYADAFRDLIQICHTNGIRLVLSTFSMAVNDHSEPERIEFYHSAFHSLHWEIKANVVLSIIVKEFARQNPDICLVDTQPALDGKSEFYTDIVHFTQPGRERMAEIFFAGITNTLSQDLATRASSVLPVPSGGRGESTASLSVRVDASSGAPRLLVNGRPVRPGCSLADPVPRRLNSTRLAAPAISSSRPKTIPKTR